MFVDEHVSAFMVKGTIYVVRSYWMVTFCCNQSFMVVINVVLNLGCIEDTSRINIP